MGRAKKGRVESDDLWTLAQALVLVSSVQLLILDNEERYRISSTWVRETEEVY